MGVACAACAGACYAGTNVLYQRLLAAPEPEASALALNGATTAVAAALLTFLVYPALWLAGVFDTPWRWTRDAAAAGALRVALFVASKLVWYGSETLLVATSGAVWAAISGVAVIPLLWLVELAAYYGLHAAVGVAWTDPGSYLQLAALAALGVGVAIHGLDPAGASEAPPAEAAARLVPDETKGRRR